MSATSTSVVALRSVGHAYGDVAVLDGVDLEVGAGEVVGIRGPSGSGKSTLLRIAAGLERPARGDVLACGVPLWSGRARRPALPRPGWVGAVFQNPTGSLDRAWTVKRILEEPLRAPHRRAVGRAERSERLADVLTRVGLAEVPLSARPAQLSGGQQQRVALARSYLAEPALLIADEPTSALDVTNAASVMRLLRELAANGTAVIVVSHDEAMLRAVADRSLVCRDGRIVRESTKRVP